MISPRAARKGFFTQYAIRNTLHGFTYVELMLSVLIFSLGYIAIVRSYSAVIDALGVSRDNIQAIVLLNEKIAKLEEDFIKEGGLEPQSQKGSFEDGFERFNWILDVEPKDDAPGINQVKLEVWWGGALRRGRVSAATYMEGEDR